MRPDLNALYETGPKTTGSKEVDHTYSAAGPVVDDPTRPTT